MNSATVLSPVYTVHVLTPTCTYVISCYEKHCQLNFELYRQKLLAGKQKENSQIFKEDFYLPLYLPLWSEDSDQPEKGQKRIMSYICGFRSARERMLKSSEFSICRFRFARDRTLENSEFCICGFRSAGERMIESSEFCICGFGSATERTS